MGILLFGLIVGWGTSQLFAQTAPTIIINELAWAGSTRSTSDEWIELRNPSETEINISGWQITKLTSGEDALMLILPSPSTIPAHGYFLISNFKHEEEDGTDKSVLNIAPNVVDSAVSLSNSALLIKLYDGDFTNGANLIDTAWDGSAPTVGDNSLKISMERDDDGGGWHDASERVNLDAGVDDLATPAAENSKLVLPPTLTSIQPESAVNDGDVEVEEIRGSNFSREPLPTLKLILGEQEIVGTNVNVVDETLIDQVSFAITDAPAGEWDLVLVNPDGQTATLPRALTITTPVTPPDLTTTLRLSEIFPKPTSTSNDEFIELYNFGETAIRLTDWQLDDDPTGGSQPFVFDEVVIAPKKFLTLYKPDTHLTLNDSGDSVLLIQPNGFVLDEVSYETAVSGETLARFDNGWHWTQTPTPNGINVLTQPPPETPPTEPTDEEEEEETPAPLADTETITYEVGDLVITELLPNPLEGESEFIEILNTTTEPIDLVDWQLKDASGKKFTIREAADVQIQAVVTLAPNQFAYFTQAISGIHLNNTGGETVELLDPNGVVIASVSYPDKAPKGAAYANFDVDSWTWTDEPTPGKPNVVTVAEVSASVSLTADTDLPSVGASMRRWWGIGLMSLCLASMLMWYKFTYEIP